MSGVWRAAQGRFIPPVDASTLPTPVARRGAVVAHLELTRQLEAAAARVAEFEAKLAG